MKKLLNTLYVMSEDAYLSLNGETVEVVTPDAKHNIPLHTLESIVCFSYKGASPALMGKCAENGISLSFFTQNGRYLASTARLENGNVLLRQEQYRISGDDEHSLPIAKSFISAKLYNAKFVLLRVLRDHPMQVNAGKIRSAVDNITAYMNDLKSAGDKSELRGIEGNSAAEYFGVFNEMILQNKAHFVFNGRNRRPPLDPVNAMLSFAYALLANDCASALSGVGIDPFVGFMHTVRPGRKSLALDLMEELRAPFADRFVLSLINNRVFGENDFLTMDNSAVIIKEDARKRFLSEWQQRKKEELTHPFLGEKTPWGLVPHIQALLLARHIRGDIDAYPPFFWK